MRIKRLTFCLLTPLCTLAGCTQTGGVRPGTGPPSEMRTVASVGDKPLPIVSGEPGASLRAETEELDLPETTGSRISGRVYDGRGKPVPNVKVRLADSGTPGGRAGYATTDRSGAFTLRGLRPGSSYAVIAEYQGDDGMMTGRAQAKAPQTEVRISLQPRDGAADQGHASIRPARPRIEPISNIDPADDEPSDVNRPAAKINAEDIEPADDDAAALSSRKTLRLSRASGDVSSTTVRAGWNLRQPSSARAGAGASVATAGARDSINDVRRAPRSSAPAEASSEPDDDGPNPLPPALDAAGTGAESAGVLPEESPVRVARNTTKSSSRTRGRSASTSGSIDRDDPKAIGIMEGPGEREPRSMPEDILPGARIITPRSSAPIVVDETPDADSPPAPSPKSSGRARSKGAVRSPSSSSDADAADSTDLNGASNTAARPTWRELAHNQADVPLDESIRKASSDAEPKPGDGGVVTLTGKTAATRPARARLLGGSRPPVDDAVKQTVCRFDPSERRLVDFQLHGLDGKMVSLHDIDADVILLDFWGSWCAPCRTSIPHLVELQAKLSGKRFQVVGIACEKGATLQDRRASADKAIKESGISYPVLLSSKDGTCPVQQALQIQFYPTLVLLDRDGRMLAREQGATEVTLSRMDRAIASALK